MNIIDRSALQLAKAIRRNDPNAASEAVLNYALVIVLNTICTIAIVLIVNLLTGYLIEGIITMFAFALLRSFSGGLHLKSSLFCTLFSAASLILISHIEIGYMYIGLILDLISIAILLVYAPKGFENRSRLDPKYYPFLKVASILIVAANFYIHSPLLSLAFFTQALTTTRAAYFILSKLERR